MMLQRMQRTGVSAMQMLVVLALLLLLLAFLAPIVQRIREAALRTQSTNNLKQLALAVHNVHDAFKGMPPIVGEFANKNGSLHFFLLPYIEQGPLYNQGTDGVWDNDVWSKPIGIYVDPRDASAPSGNVFDSWLATTSYAGNWMVFKDGKVRTTLAQIVDGTSNTLMFTQRYQMCNGTPAAWGYPGLYTWAPMVAYYNQSLFQQAPAQADCDPKRPQAIGSALLIALCDGSVRTVSPQLSAQTWANVCDPADGNVIGPDFLD
jgi:type II secretory pathway pseudopilin PulG